MTGPRQGSSGTLQAYVRSGTPCAVLAHNETHDRTRVLRVHVADVLIVPASHPDPLGNRRVVPSFVQKNEQPHYGGICKSFTFEKSRRAPREAQEETRVTYAACLRR